MTVASAYFGPDWELVGWVHYRGVLGYTEPGQPHFHQHQSEGRGGLGPGHENCEPWFRRTPDPQVVVTLP